MNLNDHLDKLKYFYEVARKGSLQGAAKVVFVSQPSLSKAIKILEDSMEKQLFIRVPRGMKLTKEGEILYSYCQEIFSSLSVVQEKLVHLDNPMTGSLKIGTYDSIAIYFWGKFLKKFLPKYPDLDIQLTTGRSGEIETQLNSGQLDLILVIEPTATKFIEVEVLKVDYFQFYESTTPNKVYSNHKRAPLIFMPSALAGFQDVEDIVYKSHLVDRKLYTTSSLESAKELTLNGLGIGFLPTMVAHEYVSSKKLKLAKLSKDFENEKLGQHSICLAYHSSRKESALIKELLKEVKSYHL